MKTGGPEMAPRSRYATKVYVILSPRRDIIDVKLSAHSARDVKSAHPGSTIEMKLATK